MTIEQASTFLVGSILTMLGFIIVVGAIVVINNIISKYWKPVRIFTPDSWTLFGHHYEMSEEDYKKIAQHIEEIKK